MPQGCLNLYLCMAAVRLLCHCNCLIVEYVVFVSACRLALFLNSAMSAGEEALWRRIVNVLFLLSFKSVFPSCVRDKSLNKGKQKTFQNLKESVRETGLGINLVCREFRDISLERSHGIIAVLGKVDGSQFRLLFASVFFFFWIYH